MTNMELIQLFGQVRGDYVLEAQALRSGKKPKTKAFPVRRFGALIAALITLLALTTTAYAVINARIKMRVVENYPEIQTTEAKENTVESQQEEAMPAQWTAYYPHSIPEGYRCIDGVSLDGYSRNINYENAEGNQILFIGSIRPDQVEIPLRPPVETEEVEVSGQSATLTTSSEGAQLLVWENPDIKFHCGILTDDPDADILAMGESVTAGEDLPLNFFWHNGQVWNAWYPRQLPGGYQCADVSSVSNGTQTVRYVKEGVVSGSIQFIISTQRDLSDIGTAPNSTMEWVDVDIDGTPGRMVTIAGDQRILFWKNEEEGFNARLDTSDPDVDLAEIAKSTAPGEPLEVTPILGPGYTVTLERGDSGYIAYEPWYPQWVPEGYTREFVGNKAYGRQDVRYANSNGSWIEFDFYFRLSPRGWRFDSAELPEQVDVNGHIGYKILSDRGWSVVWTDEERGFGFQITGPADADLLKIAQSVAPGPELEATNADMTEAALKQLGDYQFTALPEGMFEDGIAGWPLEKEDDWYSYVRRWYYSWESDAQFYFTYETYVSDSEDAAALCRMLLSGSGQPIEEVTVCGCPGAAIQNGDTATLVWADGDGAEGMIFQMSSEGFTAEELVKIAQSVKKMN